MPKLDDKKYECDFCHGIFNFIRNKEWNQKKVEEEYEEIFPGESKDNREIVCDDCWQIVKPK